MLPHQERPNLELIIIPKAGTLRGLAFALFSSRKAILFSAFQTSIMTFFWILGSGISSIPGIHHYVEENAPDLKNIYIIDQLVHFYKKITLPLQFVIFDYCVPILSLVGFYFDVSVNIYTNTSTVIVIFFLYGFSHIFHPIIAYVLGHYRQYIIRRVGVRVFGLFCAIILILIFSAILATLGLQQHYGAILLVVIGFISYNTVFSYQISRDVYDINSKNGHMVAAIRSRAMFIRKSSEAIIGGLFMIGTGFIFVISFSYLTITPLLDFTIMFLFWIFMMTYHLLTAKYDDRLADIFGTEKNTNKFHRKGNAIIGFRIATVIFLTIMVILYDIFDA